MLTNYPNWSETLQPGEQATLHVSFDPIALGVLGTFPPFFEWFGS